MQRVDITAFAFGLTLALSGTIWADSPKSPMDYVIKEIGKNDNAVIEGRPTADSAYITHYSLDYGPNSKEAMKFGEKFTKKFGAPTSIRGDLLIWDMKNPDQNLRQDEMVTIMVGPGRDGNYTLIVDRRGPAQGNNPRRFGDLKPLRKAAKSIAAQTKIAPVRSNQPD